MHDQMSLNNPVCHTMQVGIDNEIWVQYHLHAMREFEILNS